jgi:hypothetical protein
MAYDLGLSFGAAHCVSHVLLPFSSVTQFVDVVVTVAFGSACGRLNHSKLNMSNRELP